MKSVADKFHRNMELQAEESFKVFLFITKALAAMGFLFVFGQISVTGGVSTTLALVLVISAAIDIVPEIFTFRLLKVIPEQARNAEKLQLFLKGTAYLGLVFALYGLAASVLWGYAAFMILWLASFLIEISVMFLLREADSR